jgi:hypothetical protein
VATLGLSPEHGFISPDGFCCSLAGLSGAGSTVWLVFNAIFAVGWWLIVLWLIVALMGCSIWAGLLYVIRGTIDTLTCRFKLRV